MAEIWVEGIPATWETKGEKPWKERLLQELAPFDKPSCNGIELHFRLPSLAPKGQPLDVDNLCEPVFSVLVSQLGWFSGKRPNIQCWYATKSEGDPPGLRLLFKDDSVEDWEKRLTEPVFDYIHSGDLPKKGRDPQIPLWISGLGSTYTPDKTDRFFLRLLFGQNLNIGEITDGRVKNLIDCLYPIIGGTVGKPEDWRIDSLFVQKNVLAIQPYSVRITMWRK